MIDAVWCLTSSPNDAPLTTFPYETLIFSGLLPPFKVMCSSTGEVIVQSEVKRRQAIAMETGLVIVLATLIGTLNQTGQARGQLQSTGLAYSPAHVSLS